MVKFTTANLNADFLFLFIFIYFLLFFFFSPNARQLPHNLLDNGTAQVFVVVVDVVVALRVSYENDKMSTLLAVDVDAI